MNDTEPANDRNSGRNESSPATTTPSDETVAAENREAHVLGSADRPPTPEEEAAAPKGPVSSEVAEAEKAAAERGAAVKGEGQI